MLKLLHAENVLEDVVELLLAEDQLGVGRVLESGRFALVLVPGNCSERMKVKRLVGEP